MKLYPKKRFGQHFLRAPAIISEIVASINPLSGDFLIEIGPGTGAITIPIMRLTDRLMAIELDRDLAQRLRDRTECKPGLTLHEMDVLRFDFRKLGLHVGRPLRLFGNLPYNIVTPLLFKLFEQLDSISDMHFMVQKEVASRLIGQPGTKSYGKLSILTQCFCRVIPLFDIAPDAFYPPPRVDSTFIQLIPHPVPLYPMEKMGALDTVLRAAFQQRRKRLGNSLKGQFTDQQLQELSLDPSVRPDAVTLDEFFRLADYRYAAHSEIS